MLKIMASLEFLRLCGLEYLETSDGWDFEVERCWKTWRNLTKEEQNTFDENSILPYSSWFQKHTQKRSEMKRDKKVLKPGREFESDDDEFEEIEVEIDSDSESHSKCSTLQSNWEAEMIEMLRTFEEMGVHAVDAQMPAELSDGFFQQLSHRNPLFQLEWK